MDTSVRQQHWLRSPRTSLIGREADIASVLALLQRDDVGIVTLTGPGGVGKTQMAMHVVMAEREVFGDDIVLVDLSVVSAPSEVVPAIAQSAGLRSTAETDALESVSRYFARLGTTLLLIDNVEHVLAASAAIAELLALCPNLTVLATSREPLQIRDEHVYPVVPLSVPRREDDLSLVEAASYDAVRLFLARAQAVQPEFEITSDNVAAVADICRRLDGLPLAIELAALRVHVLPPNAMQPRLEQLLPMLDGSSRDMPQRQHTVFSTIGWSYDLLTPEEQRFFRHMVVFSGGFTLDSAAFVASRVPGLEMHPLQILTSLVDKNLIQREDIPGEPRYTMLETIRQFGYERLVESGEVQDASGAHADWFVDVAVRAASACRRVVPLAEIRQLEIEHPNIRAALSWLLSTGQMEKLRHLSIDLGWFWYVGRHEHEGLGWLRLASEPREGADIRDRAEAARWAAMLAQRVHHRDTASLLDRAGVLAEASGDARLQALSTKLHAIQAVHAGEYDAASMLLDTARTQIQQVDEPWHALDIEFNRACVAFGTGDFATAVATLERVREAGIAIGDLIVPTWTLRVLCLIASEQGRYDRAAATLRASLDSEYYAATPVRQQYSWPLILGCTAVLAAKLESWAPAARLQGSAAADSRSGVIAHPESATFAKAEAEVQHVLGDDAWREQVERGGAMRSVELGAEIERVLAAAEQAPGAASRDEQDIVLTPREREVLRLMVEGRSNREIAETLFITVRTAKAHVSNILAKFDVESRTAAVTYAHQHNLV